LFFTTHARETHLHQPPKAKKSPKKNLNESVVKAAQKRIDAPDLKSRDDVEDTERKRDHVPQRHSCFVLSPAEQASFSQARIAEV
jgi:hypothetical protein